MDGFEGQEDLLPRKVYILEYRCDLNHLLVSLFSFLSETGGPPAALTLRARPITFKPAFLSGTKSAPNAAPVYHFKHPNGMILTPSGRVYAYSPPVITISRSGSLSGTCFSFSLCSLIRRTISFKWVAPSSISLLPSLHSIRAYRPSSRCSTTSASSP